jgi:hypothetical protein
MHAVRKVTRLKQTLTAPIVPPPISDKYQSNSILNGNECQLTRAPNGSLILNQRTVGSAARQVSRFLRSADMRRGLESLFPFRQLDVILITHLSFQLIGVFLQRRRRNMVPRPCRSSKKQPVKDQRLPSTTFPVGAHADPRHLRHVFCRANRSLTGPFFFCFTWTGGALLVMSSSFVASRENMTIHTSRDGLNWSPIVNVYQGRGQ